MCCSQRQVKSFSLLSLQRIVLIKEAKNDFCTNEVIVKFRDPLMLKNMNWKGIQ